MRKKLTIVNVDGVVVEDPENLRALIRDFAAIDGLKLFVHGEGTMASMVAEKMGITIRQTSDGRDIIDDRVMDLVTMVYGGLVNKRLVAIMQWRGLNALGLTGVDLNLVLSNKVPIKPVNVGRVGTVKRVNSSMLIKLLEENVVPVIAPLTHDGKGNLLNGDVTMFAYEIARTLTLAYDVTVINVMGEENGVLTNDDNPNSVIPMLRRAQYKALREKGVIKPSAYPTVDRAISAIDHGVREVIIINAARFSDLHGGTHIK
ncbi:MAG: acetylglutamate kinase [Muribaculaceae bacterium]|nr:acetylglutamate kinase [Muribaculaceae bacterium]